jgi:exosortase A-associated hydrolase 2
LSGSAFTAEFIATGKGRIFVLARHPRNFSGQCVLVVPPFAEEMNKSRKMITELAQRVSARRLGVVIPDFFGTGDSEGDFSQTDCETWLDDLGSTEKWLRERNWSVAAVLGIRLGCVVAAEHLRRRDQPVKSTIFWQPMLDGARALEQFLRLRVAASLMEDKKETVADLKADIASGAPVEVAGYGISKQLVVQIEHLKLASSIGANVGNLHWFEVLRSAEAPVPVPTSKFFEQLQAKGISATLHTVHGEPFWASTEVVCLPTLLEATAIALSELST